MAKWAAVLFTLAAAVLAGCASTPLQAPAPTPESPTSPLTSGQSTTAPASTQPTPASGVLRVHYVDVGQGDGTIWQLPDGTVIVFDCGDTAASAAANPMNTFLRDELGLLPGAHIHALIASHGHQDHIGGCEEILDEYFVDHLYDTWYEGSDAPQSYTTFREQVRAEGGTIHPFGDDSTLATDQPFKQWDPLVLPAAAQVAGVAAQIIWPSSEVSDWNRIAEAGIAVRLSFGSTDFCFQGDIETAEEATLAGYPFDLNCEVYLMGHHGSRYASSTTWLNKMRPRFAPVSFGENSYGHPTSEALCRVQQSGAPVYATHRLGSITVETDGTTISIDPDKAEAGDYCQAGASYWSTAPPGSSAPPTTTAAPASSAGIEIVNIVYDPPGNDEGENLVNELVEIRNSGSSDTSFQGWRLHDAANSPNTYSFPSGFTLGAGATVKVRTGTGTNTDTDLYWNRAQAVWNNSGDTAYLKDSAGAVVDSQSYGS